VSSSLFPAFLFSSFRLNRGAKVRTFFYSPNIFKKKNYLFLWTLSLSQLLYLHFLAVWECKGKTLFPPFPNIILLFFLTIYPNSLLFKDFYLLTPQKFFVSWYLFGVSLYVVLCTFLDWMCFLGSFWPVFSFDNNSKYFYSLFCNFTLSRVRDSGSTIAHQPWALCDLAPRPGTKAGEDSPTQSPSTLNLILSLWFLGRRGTPKEKSTNLYMCNEFMILWLCWPIGF
jgi:hypothetical protein